MSYKENNDYRNLPFNSQLLYETNFYTYADIDDLLAKCKEHKEQILKCRTVGILESNGGCFYLKAVVLVMKPVMLPAIDQRSLCYYTPLYYVLRFFGEFSIEIPSNEVPRRSFCICLVATYLPGELINLRLCYVNFKTEAPKIRVSMVYVKTAIPSTVIPCVVQIFGTLQWEYKPIIYASILQVLNTATGIRLNEALKSVANTHLANQFSKSDELK